MLAKVCLALVGLVLLAALVGATASLAQSPTPSPPPIPTRPAPPEPLSAGCAPGALPSPLALDSPSDLWLETTANPNLPDLPPTVVVLHWKDNSADELCFAVERRVGDGPWEWLSAVQADQRGTYGDGLVSGGAQCYRVSAGDDGGRSGYSNEACVNVEVLPVWATPTPTPTPTPPRGSPTPLSGPLFSPWPPACQGEGPVGSPGAPSPPSNLRAELVTDSIVLEGFVVRLEWYDNADNEACSVIERKIGDGEWVLQGGSGPSDPWNTGPIFVNDVPQQVGSHCYRIFYGNDAGRSAYSSEACVNVEVVPKILTPTPPPFPCYLEELPRSELGPSPPTNLTALLVADPTVPGGLRVDLAWQDNATDEQCQEVERLEHDGAWHSSWRGVGEDPTTAIDSQPSLGQRCYRVSVANEHGWSAFSNEACATGPAVTVTPTPVTTPVAATPVTPSALPITGAGSAHADLAWWWWALVAAGSALLGVAALSLVRVARRRR